MSRAQRSDRRGVVMPTREQLLEKVQRTLDERRRSEDAERAVDLDLGLRPMPALVAGPLRQLYGPSAEATLAAPLHAYFLDVEQLLIVGEPGAGKSTKLQELCQALLDHARRHPAFPVPVVINIAGYSSATGSLIEWLPEGLYADHAIPRKIGAALLDEGALLLLLDGLDEVAPARRERCIAEINALVAEQHTLNMYLAVCSRTTEYAEGSARLAFPAAITVQPLTTPQALDALEHAGPQTTGLRAAIARDPALAELLHTPLMLNIAARALAGVEHVELEGDDQADLRRALYDRYLIRRLRDKNRRGGYEPAQIIYWLRFLAGTMRDEAQTVFLIERMQPGMLPSPSVYLGAIWIGFSLTVGFVAWVVAGPAAGLGGVLVGWLGLGLGLGLDIKPVEQLVWSWQKAAAAWGGSLSKGFVGGLGIGLLAGDAYGPAKGQIIGLTGILVFTLYACVFTGWAERLNDTSAHPNAGISATIKNGLIQAGIGALIGGVGFWLVGGARLGLFSALGFGLNLGLHLGLGEALKHYILRLLLARHSLLPFDIVPFLNTCCDLLLLRRQGGAYAFIHLTLRDYLAELTEADVERLGRAVRD